MRNSSRLFYHSILACVLCSSFSVYGNDTPHLGWRVEVEPFLGLATDTLLTNSIFAVKVADPAIQGDSRILYHLDSDNDWGARLAFGYDFKNCPDSSYGWSLEYTFLNENNSRHITNNARSSAGRPVLAPAEFIDITDESSARFSNANTKFSQQYDTLDLVAEKKYFLCNCSIIKLFGGIRYFHYREELKNNYKFVGDINGVNVHNIYDVNFENQQDTIGPRVGADIFYHIINGFGITGQIATSLLYGKSQSEFHNSYSLTPDSDLGPATQLTSSNHLDDSAQVIPAVSGKVALAYQACFRSGYSIAIEGGYRGDWYFNAINDVAYQQLLAGDDINSNSNYQDLKLSGPYLSVTLRI